jgi:small subunit ribosomal protein S18
MSDETTLEPGAREEAPQPERETTRPEGENTRPERQTAQPERQTAQPAGEGAGADSTPGAREPRRPGSGGGPDRDAGDARGPRDSRDSRESRDSRDSRDSRESRDDSRSGPPRGRGRDGRPRFRGYYRRKVCKFCTKRASINYRDADALRRFITDRGKILPRRITGTCPKHQRALSTAIKQARVLALLPFVEK